MSRDIFSSSQATLPRIVLTVYPCEEVVIGKIDKIIQKTVDCVSRVMRTDGYFFTRNANVESELLTCSPIGFLTVF